MALTLAIPGVHQMLPVDVNRRDLPVSAPRNSFAMCELDDIALLVGALGNLDSSAVLLSRSHLAAPLCPQRRHA